jgi:hypothetical protein
MIAKFSTAEDLMAHYASVRARLHGPAPKVIIHPAALPLPPEPEPEPEPEPIPPPPVPMVRTQVYALQPHEIRISFEEVIVLVCNHTQHHRREIFAPRRTKHICFSRQLLWALARKFCWHMSLPQIGRASGGKDHTTILHGCKKGEKHPDFEKLCQVLEKIYEEKHKHNNELIAQIEMEKEGV